MFEFNSAGITKKQIEMLLNGALGRLYKDDRYLIDNRPYRTEMNGSHHVGERAIVFRLAHYMQNIMDKTPQFSNYVLDCEYNRNGVHAKVLPSFSSGVYPDVIIHNRGNNSNNLLIMEVKTYWNLDNSQDIKKIKEFTDVNGEYCFLFGVSLVITRQRKDVRIEWFYANYDCGLTEEEG